MPIFLPMAVGHDPHDPLDYSGGITPLPRGLLTAPRLIFLWSYKDSWFWEFGDIALDDRAEPFGAFQTEERALEFAEFVSGSRGIIVNFEAPNYYYWKPGINYSLSNE